MDDTTLLQDITSLKDPRAQRVYAFYGLYNKKIIYAYMTGLHYDNDTKNLLLPVDEKPLHLVYDSALSRTPIIKLNDAFIVTHEFINHLASAATINYELTRSQKIILDSEDHILEIERNEGSNPLNIAHGCLASIDILAAQIHNPILKAKQKILKNSLRTCDDYFK